jgi:hypothetical protein
MCVCLSVSENCKLVAQSAGVTKSIGLTDGRMRHASLQWMMSLSVPQPSTVGNTHCLRHTNTSNRAHKSRSLAPSIYIPINVLRDIRDMSVNVMASLGFEQPRNRSSIPGRENGFFSYPQRLGWPSEPHNPLFNRYRKFHLTWSSRGMKLITHVSVVPRLTVRGAVLPFSILPNGVLLN